MQADDNILQFSKGGNTPDNGGNTLPLRNYDKLFLGLLPFTPVMFTGSDSLLAWGRLAGYSLLAYWTYNRMRPLSYVMMGAAGISLATSLTSKMWSKK